MKLFEITNQYKGLMSMADELPEDALQNTLDSITDELETKAVSIIHVIKNMDTLAIDEELRRLQHMKKMINNRKQRLTDYLRESMIDCNITKIEAPTLTITLRKPTQAVQIDEPDTLPAKYTKVSITPNKVAIKAALVLGKEIPGCRMVDGQRGLLIK